MSMRERDHIKKIVRNIKNTVLAAATDGALARAGNGSGYGRYFLDELSTALDWLLIGDE